MQLLSFEKVKEVFSDLELMMSDTQFGFLRYRYLQLKNNCPMINFVKFLDEIAGHNNAKVKENIDESKKKSRP